MAAVFSLLATLYVDDMTAQVFSERRTVESWLAAEVALARAQAGAGVISTDDAARIAAAAVMANVDLPRLWRESRNVGYPILPLVRMLAEALPGGAGGRVHYGATTQDIMDSGLALQLSEALTRLAALVGRFGDALAAHVDVHRRTVMAARTHAQQAVPTTFGAKLAVLLDELGRHAQRLREVRPRVCRVSLFGAGGTSAALGPHATEIRTAMAAELGLASSGVPWHVARDGIAELGGLCALLSATSCRFAREVIDLSRTEVGEVSEPQGHHRGASSTMPQKANPILSEAVVGMAATAGALASSLYRAMEAGHERAAGEWQIEWQVVPQLAVLAASSLAVAAEIAEGLVVETAAMRRNLTADGGLLMAEAHMMRLAPELGRERAHDLVYAAAKRARGNGTSLEEALGGARSDGGESLRPDDYLGAAEAICDEALQTWRASRPATEEARP